MQKCPAILVVEDDPFDRELIELAFRDVCPAAPFRSVSNGAEAIGYLSGTEPYTDRTKYPYPHLIVTDLKMPQVDGFALLDFLRLHPQLTVVPTVMFSSSSDQNDVLTAYRLGASSYIVKPATAPEIRRQMRALVEYWSFCEAPSIKPTGEHRDTDAQGKLGERYTH